MTQWDQKAADELQQAVRGTRTSFDRLRRSTQAGFNKLQLQSQAIKTNLERAEAQAGGPQTTFEDKVREGLTWLQSDDTGCSSKAMVHAIIGCRPDKQKQEGYRRDAHPYDPDDLGRCLRLIKKLPWAKEALPILASRCSVWKRLANEWDVLEAMMDSEVGIDWSKGSRAPTTYDYMKQVLSGRRGR